MIGFGWLIGWLDVWSYVCVLRCQQFEIKRALTPTDSMQWSISHIQRLEIDWYDKTNFFFSTIFIFYFTSCVFIRFLFLFLCSCTFVWFWLLFVTLVKACNKCTNNKTKKNKNKKTLVTVWNWKVKYLIKMIFLYQRVSLKTYTATLNVESSIVVTFNRIFI